MSAVAWLNGRFVAAEKAIVPLSDAAVQHGVGLFETMRASHGRIFRAEAHLARLEASARVLGLAPTLSAPALARAAQATVERSGLIDARVRVTVTGGTLNLLRQDGAEHARLTIAITAQPMMPFAEAAYLFGVSVRIAEPRISASDPFAGHKTINYWPRLHALRRAGEAGFDEALWFSTDETLVGASVGNAFLVVDGGLVTPPARQGDAIAPTLPGITRAAILEVAARDGVEVRERPVERSMLEEAREIFLTNSMWGVLPVSRVHEHRVGDGTPGPVTRRLREHLKDLLERETRG